MDKAADFANYFCTYAFLYHQKEMLSDRVRMDAYHTAVFRNARHFAGKVCFVEQRLVEILYHFLVFWKRMCILVVHSAVTSLFWNSSFLGKSMPPPVFVLL